MAERCTCCDILVEFCGRAAADAQRREQAARRQRLAAAVGTLIARYPGRCAGCEEPYKDGEVIRRSTDESGWLASCCLDDYGRPVDD